MSRDLPDGHARDATILLTGGHVDMLVDSLVSVKMVLLRVENLLKRLEARTAVRKRKVKPSTPKT